MPRRQYPRAITAKLLRPLDREGPVLMHDELSARVRRLIDRGDLRPGDYLPPMRWLSTRLGISLGTVVRAYETLARTGAVVPSSTRGVQVRAAMSPSPNAARPWATCIDPPVPATDPFIVPEVRPLTPTVRFDTAECGAELRGSAFLDGLLTEARQKPELWGYSCIALADFSQAIEHYLRGRGVSLEDAVTVETSGAVAALTILTRALAPSGGVVITEHPTYHVAIAVFAAAGLHVMGIPVDDEGLRVDLLPGALARHRPRFIYVQPAFQNPTGVTLSGDRRHQLVEIARRASVPIIEDDFAAELAFGAPPPPLRTDDAASIVIYIKSFSKVLLPALRAGVIVAPAGYNRTIRSLQHGLDPYGSAWAQWLLARALPSDEFQRHTRRVGAALHQRWEALEEAFHRHLPAQSRWSRPRGGLCTWLELPAPIQVPDLVPSLASAGVWLTPGSYFCLDQSGARAARLAFGAVTLEAIDTGVRALGEAARHASRASTTTRHAVLSAP